MAVVSAATGPTCAKSHVWRYGFGSADQAQAMDYQKLVCKLCLRAFQTKRGNTSNLAKHLKDRHSDLYKELRVREF